MLLKSTLNFLGALVIIISIHHYMVNAIVFARVYIIISFSTFSLIFMELSG